MAKNGYLRLFAIGEPPNKCTNTCSPNQANKQSTGGSIPKVQSIGRQGKITLMSRSIPFNEE